MPPETRPARPLEAPLRPWLSPNVFGVTATAIAPIATTATATTTARDTRQRSAASVARPTSSAPRLDRDSVSSSPTHRTASTPVATSWSRWRRS